VEKKTAVSPLNDMDVAVLLRVDRIPDDQYPRLLEHVRELLIQVYHPKPRDDYSLGRHAVRIRFHDANLSVDVVPLITHPDDKDFGLLSTRDSEELVTTSIPLHLRFIRKRIREHPAYLELVRLTKWWRNEQEVHFKSFLIELLWAHLLDKRTVTGDDLGEALLGFFGYMVRTGLREPISFADYGQGTVAEATQGPVRVLDPVNPENNVAAPIDEGRREVLVAACRKAFEALAAAQTAPTAAVARGYFQRVLGPRFGYPRDTAGEATSPSSKEHVRAKILADLRQLRVLYGGFDRAAEAGYASALSLWIDSALAVVIELVYYAPPTRDRLLSLRYTIDQTGITSADDDPAGIPVRRLDGARFAIHAVRLVWINLRSNYQRWAAQRSRVRCGVHDRSRARRRREVWPACITARIWRP
jgi:hypothetical protein